MCPLSWWQTNASELSYWSTAARQVVLIQPSSASSERTFSKTFSMTDRIALYRTMLKVLKIGNSSGIIGLGPNGWYGRVTRPLSPHYFTVGENCCGDKWDWLARLTCTGTRSWPLLYNYAQCSEMCLAQYSSEIVNGGQFHNCTMLQRVHLVSLYHANCIYSKW